MAENFSKSKETPAVNAAVTVASIIAGAVLAPGILAGVVVGMFAGFIYSGVRGYSIEDMMKFTSIGAVAGLAFSWSAYTALQNIVGKGILADSTFALPSLLEPNWIVKGIFRKEVIYTLVGAVSNMSSVIGLGLKGQFTFAGLGYDFNDNLLLHFGSETSLPKSEVQTHRR